MTNFYRWREQQQVSELYNCLSQNPVAYFCLEFALPANLPIYAGGLGVLAGDFVIEAKNQDFPMVGVGLLYTEQCRITADGAEYCEINDPMKLGLSPVLDKLGYRIKVEVPIEGRAVQLQAWLYNQGTVPVYLLDANITENDPLDRKIFSLLYVISTESRLKQEILLGIGGAAMLEAIGIVPSIYHMNEGHSAFLVYEVAKQFMHTHSIGFAEAFGLARKKIAYTNHTLVVGVHDLIDVKLVSRLLESFAKDINVPVASLVLKGADKKNKKRFSTTFLALESAFRTNAVSQLHAKEALKYWPDKPMAAITNGINEQRWDKIGEGNDLEKRHAESKKKLLKYIAENTGVKWRDGELLAGWARRIATYKRPASFFEDIESVKKILKNRKMPLRLVFSGKPHYQDKEGQWILTRLRQLAANELKGSMVFLEEYSTDLAEMMVAGCDVWINTPIVGLEACGTSTMKAALNGTLLCSTNDGWICEVDLEKLGFVLDSNYISWSLVDNFSNRIAPLYYQYQSKGQMKSIWAQKMEYSRNAIIHHFGTDRMLKDYIEQIYQPILAANQD